MNAVQALELLQEDVSLQEELAGLLERDPSPDVRRATLNAIIITDHTLPGGSTPHRTIHRHIKGGILLGMRVSHMPKLIFPPPPTA